MTVMTMKPGRLPLDKAQIPDLWEISQLKALDGYSLGGRSASVLIKETWHLAHDLKKLNAELLEACQEALVHMDEFNGDTIKKLKSVITKATT